MLQRVFCTFVLTDGYIVNYDGYIVNYNGYIIDYERYVIDYERSIVDYDVSIALHMRDTSNVTMYPSKSSYDGYIALKFKYIIALASLTKVFYNTFASMRSPKKSSSP